MTPTLYVIELGEQIIDDDGELAAIGDVREATAEEIIAAYNALPNELKDRYRAN